MFEERREEPEWVKTMRWQKEEKVVFVAECWEGDRLRFFAWSYIWFPGADDKSYMYSIWYKFFKHKKHYFNWKRLIEAKGWTVMRKQEFELGKTEGGRFVHWDELLCPEDPEPI